jgi:hypothetical protein
MFAWLTFFVLQSCSSSYSSSQDNLPKKQDVVVLVIDTLRDDHFRIADTPYLDSVIKNGQVARQAWAPSTWTAPSIISLFTGKTVREHGWDFPMPKVMQLYNFSYPSIPEDTKTFAQVLQQHGYQTHGFYSNPLLRREVDFDRGFTTWILTNDLEITQNVQDFVSAHSTVTQSQFFYIHLLGPHQPLNPSPSQKDKYNVNTAHLNQFGGMGLQKVSENKTFLPTYQKLYKGVIEDTDKKVKNIIQLLEQHLDNPLIVITSDHGEMLGEHNLIGHKQSMYEELLQVPYIVKRNKIPLPELMSVTATADFICKNLDIDFDWSVKVEQLSYLSAQREGSIALYKQIKKTEAKGIWNANTSFVDKNLQIKQKNHQYFNLSKNPAEASLGKDHNRRLDQEEIKMLLEQKKHYESLPMQTLSAEEAFFTDEILHGLRVLGYIE